MRSPVLMSGSCSPPSPGEPVLSMVSETVMTDSRKCSSYSSRYACTSRRSSGSAQRALTSASRSAGGIDSASASTPFAARHATASIVLQALHLPPQPQLRGRPLALDRGRRYFQDFGDLFHRQTGEEAH